MIKIDVNIVVYNRLENLKEWIRCWKMSETKTEKFEAKLFIIHNYDSLGHSNIFETVVKNANDDSIIYIGHENIGYDIGRYQDIALKRLTAEYDNDWHYSFFCADDCIPMRRDFIQLYLNAFTSNVGCVAYHISHAIKTHVRTTGFMLPKSVVERLIFEADPILSKDDCYNFEHRTNYSLKEQIERMNLRVVQVANLYSTSCMYDTDRHSGWVDRIQEHFNNFPR